MIHKRKILLFWIAYPIQNDSKVLEIHLVCGKSN